MLSPILAAVLLLQGHSWAAVVPVLRSGAAGLVQMVGIRGWAGTPDHVLFSRVPFLSSLNALPGGSPVAQALRRSLDRAGLSFEDTAVLPTDQQARAVHAALDAAATAALGPAAVPPEAGLSERIARTADLRSAVRDLRAALSVLPGGRRQALEPGLAEAEAALDARFQALSRELVESKLKDIGENVRAAWNGRTADIPLEDGSVLSLKWHVDDARMAGEGSRMEEARRYGLSAPVALPPARGKPPVERERRFPKVQGPFGEALPYEGFLPYLKPKELAPGYQSYLNDRLAAEFTPAEKIALVQAAAFKAVDDMLLLFRNGLAHSTLMPLSHHGAHWEWDYWRWNQPFLGGMRYGPSFIQSWRKAFEYPNIRLSGLADFEHLEPWRYFEVEHRHPDHRKGMVRHDAYSMGIGQNLTELSFLLLHAGAVNRLSHGETARLVKDSILRYLRGVLPGETVAGLDERGILSAARSSSRRFRLVRAAWPALVLAGALGVAIPILAGAAAAGVLSNVVIAGLFGALVAHVGAGAGHAPFNLPGTVIDPLIMRAVKPAVELMRRNAGLVGLAAAEHPSGSPWRGRMGLLLAVAVPAAFFLPAALFGIGTAMSIKLIAMATGSYVAGPGLVYAAAGAGLALAAARLLRSVIAGLRRRSAGGSPSA